MPKMSGPELFEALKDAGIKIPVVFVTAFPNDNLRGRALKAGAIAYLAKPCSGSILLENIKKALEYDKLN
jgi:FixJ family two-component response regulator